MSGAVPVRPLYAFMTWTGKFLPLLVQDIIWVEAITSTQKLEPTGCSETSANKYDTLGNIQKKKKEIIQTSLKS